MDTFLIPENVRRCPVPAFLVWILPCLLLMLWGVAASILCLGLGLNQTNMTNALSFALWIVWDLSIIALGAGAFFTGFLYYIVGKKELKDIINIAVLIGFICYSGTMGLLAIDVGQPLRVWFIYWHANVHSMLVEVSFCITCYLIVLSIEYIPILAKNPVLSRIREVRIFGSNLHHIMAVFAATGTFLSFFHQGSLGGMFGSLFARPFAAREGIYIWPWTFFLFILSAIAAGPCFTIVCTKLAEFITRKKLVGDKSIHLLAKISGWLLLLYLILKAGDTLAWIYGIVPKAGLTFMDFYSEGPYGVWLLGCEILLLGVVPAVILLSPGARKKPGLLVTACVMNCAGIALNRFIIVIMTLAIPVMPFDGFRSYLPNWQEWAIALSVVGYGFLVFSLSYRYLPVFPAEKELNASGKK